MYMAIENPLDKAAEIARSSGDMAAGLLGGTARFLEQVTGDAFTAAVFAAMLIFTLSLVKGAAGARNPSIYINSIIIIGIFIMSAIVALAVYGAQEQFSIEAIEYKERLYIHKGFNVPFRDNEPVLMNMIFAKFAKLKWYSLIGAIMTVAGIIMKILVPRTVNKLGA